MCMCVCVYIYIFLLGTFALGRHFPSQFPGDHTEGQKGENAHPNSPFPHPGKSMGFVDLTSQFMLMEIIIVVSI